LIASVFADSFGIVSCIALLGAVCLSGMLVLGACGSVHGEPIVLPSPDAREFAEEVYPQLLHDCGFVACHGDPARFFRVYGPGRTRLDPDTLPYDPASSDEIQSSYDRARSMLSGVGSIYESQLLRKPLAKSAGGSEHKGVDRFGRNVYPSPMEPGYQILARWAIGAQAADGGSR
jgi:hypothetical protein